MSQSECKHLCHYRVVPKIIQGNISICPWKKDFILKQKKSDLMKILLSLWSDKNHYAGNRELEDTNMYLQSKRVFVMHCRWSQNVPCTLHFACFSELRNFWQTVFIYYSLNREIEQSRQSMKDGCLPLPLFRGIFIIPRQPIFIHLIPSQRC